MSCTEQPKNNRQPDQNHTDIQLRDLQIHSTKSVPDPLTLQFTENVFIYNDQGTKILCKFCHRDSASEDGLLLPESETEDSAK